MKNKITKAGYAELEKELLYLRAVKRKEVEDALREASTFGDLRENSEYDAAVEQQARVERRIQELERGLANVEVFERKSSTVDIGSMVTIYYEEDNLIEEYTIVNPMEVNILENKISPLSPLGEKLIGSSINEILEIENEEDSCKIKIVKIR